MNLRSTLPFLALATACVIAAEGNKDGFKDTPIIPGTKWHIHDPDRPLPKVVTPGEFSTQEKAGTAPNDAKVLFDGKDLKEWKSGESDAKWKVENGYFEVVSGTGTLRTKEQFGPDVQLHIEWQAPPAKHSGQARGNSGVFFYDRYEIQVLDTFENLTYADGHAGALYSQTPPLVNAVRKPGEWNVYDIVFNGPRFDKEGKIEKPAHATVFVNGVLVQNHTQLIGRTDFRTTSRWEAHGEKGPISLQDHGNPMRFRNVWIRELQPVDSGK